MTKLNSIIRLLNKELDIKSIVDDSRNGLQVKSNKEVKKVAFAVDACLSTFEKAKKAKADLIIVHHGLLWKGKKDPTGLKKKGITFLKKNKISLYACHLPLDKNKKYGNNIELCRILNLEKLRQFGAYHNTSIGYQGTLPKTTNIKKIAQTLNKKLKTKSIILKNSKTSIKTVAVISGGGRSAIGEAAKKKIDCFVTGEVPHSSVNDAKDLKLNILLVGHYATETLGVKALMPLIKEKFNIETVFIDNPTGF